MKRVALKAGGNGARALALLPVLALAACGVSLPRVPLPDFGATRGDPEQAKALEEGTVLFSRGAESGPGYVAADEPEAAKVGRGILERNGRAADAAAAMAFSLALTYPNAGGLGGGGFCLARGGDGAVEAFSFPAKASASGGAIAIPGVVRGFGLLHARHGGLKWSEVVAPAERLALTGVVVSRAFSDEIGKVASERAGALAPYRQRTDGRLLVEGDRRVDPALASTLAAIREGGPSSFYTGDLARRIVAAAASAGGSFSLAELEAYAPAQDTARKIDLGDMFAHAVPERFGAGQVAGALLVKASAGRAALETAMSEILASAPPVPDRLEGGAVSFVVVDRERRAVACALTMSEPFGASFMVPETGILLAPNPARSPSAVANAFLTPVIVTTKRGSLRFAAAGNGDREAPVRLAAAVGLVLTKNSGKSQEVASAIKGDRESAVHFAWCPAYASETGAPCGVVADRFGLALIAAP